MKKLKIFIVIFIAILSVSCSADLELDAPVATNLPFLSLPDDTDFTNLTDDEKGILITAISRVKIFENADGLFELKAKSAKEVNISRDIYLHLIQTIQYTNDQLLFICGNNRHDVISRNPSSPIITTDCISQAIQVALGIPYNSVHDFIYTEHGDKFSIDKLDEIFAHYNNVMPGKFMPVSPEYFTSGETLDHKVIIVFSGSGIARAVNGSSVFPKTDDNGKLIFTGNDFENGGNTVYIPADIISSIYIYQNQ